MCKKGAAREEALLASSEKFKGQQLTLDEYRAKAQASVAAANARTMQVTQQRHQAEERARESGDKAEALRREHASLYREAEVGVLVS